MTAAARLIEASNRGPSGTAPGVRWQDRAWRYYDELGEVHYAANFYGQSVARVRLIVQEQSVEGEWEEVTSGPAHDALAELGGERGDLGDLQRAYGIQMFVAGESYLVGTVREGQAVWEMLSGSEVVVQGDRVRIRRRAGKSEGDEEHRLAGEVGEGQAVVYRLWQQHPRHSDEPDSPLRGVLDTAEELLMLSRAVRGRARSRAAGAGMLLVPSEAFPEPEGDGMDEDPDRDPFLRDLVETMTTPLSDEGAAAGVVPMVVRAAREHLEAFRHLSLAETKDRYAEAELRNEAIRRLALGLDMPPEVLLGLSVSNHWTGWAIKEETWTTHIEPKARQLCGDLTSIYLRPLLGDLEGRFRVWYDPAGVVTHPDRSRDAKDSHDRLVISDAALREAAGFDEVDAPEPDELERRIAIKLGDLGAALGGEPSGNGGAPPAPSPPPGTGPAETEEGPPDGDASARVAGAAMAAAWRCREAAGARILTRLQREGEELRERVRDVPRADVAATLGLDEVAALGLRPEALVSGGADCLRAMGLPEWVAVQIEGQAADSLFDHGPRLDARLARAAP